MRIVLAIVCLFSLMCHAQLEFEKTELIGDAKPGQKEYTAVYKFKNTGSKTVHIIRTKSTCACTANEMPKRVYKPGESGTLEMVMKFGLARGEIRKKIYVFVKEADEKKHYELMIGANIPDYVKFSEKVLTWETDEGGSKTISLEIVHDKPINIFKVHCSNPNWKAELDIVKEGWEYTIQIEPQDTSIASRTVISVELDFPSNNHLVYRVSCRVKQPALDSTDSPGCGGCSLGMPNTTMMIMILFILVGVRAGRC